MLDTTFSPWPAYTEEEADAVRRVLRSGRVNYWTGRECRQFEKEFAAATGCAHGVAVANGTLALEIALRALEIGPGDEVIVTPRSFVASASCVLNVGATPVFADVDPDSQNITAETVAAVLGPRTCAVLCVHLAGWPCDMDAITSLARERGLRVIEDCAQAHGAVYRGRPAGSLGHIAAWSFCQDKIITTPPTNAMSSCARKCCVRDGTATGYWPPSRCAAYPATRAPAVKSSVSAPSTAYRGPRPDRCPMHRHWGVTRSCSWCIPRCATTRSSEPARLCRK